MLASKCTLIVALSRNGNSLKPNIGLVNLSVSTCSESLAFFPAESKCISVEFLDVHLKKCLFCIA